MNPKLRTIRFPSTHTLIRICVAAAATFGIAAAANGLIFLSGNQGPIEISGNHNTIIVPSDPVDLQPADIACAPAAVVKIASAPNAGEGAQTYTALLTNDEGTRTYFIRWTDAADLSDRLVVEATFPDPNTRATLQQVAYPDADSRTIGCLKTKAKRE